MAVQIQIGAVCVTTSHAANIEPAGRRPRGHSGPRPLCPALAVYAASRVQVDAVCDVEEDLLKLAWQVAAPRERRGRGKRGLVEADADHFAAVGGPVFRGSAPSSQVPWSGQHGGGSACGRREGEGQRKGLPERRVGKFEPRVRGPQGRQPGGSGELGRTWRQSCITRRGSRAMSWSAPAHPTSYPGWLAVARASATRDDLPMPGSPSTQTTVPSLRPRASMAARRTASSCSRPTHCGGRIGNMQVIMPPPRRGACPVTDIARLSAAHGGSSSYPRSTHGTSRPGRLRRRRRCHLRESATNRTTTVAHAASLRLRDSEIRIRMLAEKGDFPNEHQSPRWSRCSQFSHLRSLCGCGAPRRWLWFPQLRSC